MIEKKNKLQHNFKKSLGQNFLTDKNLLSALVSDSGIGEKSQVLEIGMGGGALTEVLTQTANKVVGYEIDLSLQDFLQDKFANRKNLTMIFKDALKEKTKDIDEHFSQKYCVVANIPYYITSPLIFKFMEESDKVDFQAIMVQKEVAERIVALPNTDSYGALSVVCQYHNNCKILRIISKKMFRPTPKVDSAFIKLTKTKSFDFEYSLLVKNSFSMRRKTLVNNLLKAYSIPRDVLNDIFDKLNFNINVRAESLSPNDYEKLLLQIKTNLSK